ncbi:hypothetical protein FAZ95_36750 [Trinickia violacea]|uniref:DUF2502 domain-containing protein n=1 Tax=Trinickia violacea TaxID=2571746 RepID=A0A4P8J228_9BURK|nr:hypothetical protein [Trinickia violacea]QCP55031.1 hypothetical protein FAZ95_36750 [Trinickia violacea]
MKRLLPISLATGIGPGFAGAAYALNLDVNVGTPAPVVVAPAVIGWHGDWYWDGHRYWARRDWEEHNRHPGEHCPPGHAKKGEC